LRQFNIHIILIQTVALLVGFNIISSNIIGFFIIFLSIYILYVSTKRENSEAIYILIFLLFLEPYSRANIIWLPYLFFQYLLISFSIIQIVSKRKDSNKSKSTALVFFLFFLIELLHITYNTNMEYYRSIVINTSALFFLIFSSSYYYSVKLNIEKIIKSIAYGGAYLAGIILVSHLKGNIEFGTESNFLTSGGMGPVQISYYLSITALVFFIIFLNSKKNIDKIINIIQMVFIISLSILTFSRGGLYFFVTYVLIYIFYNIKKFKRLNIILYFIIMIFALYLSFSYTIEYSDNKILDRFSEQNTGNRDVLVGYGLEIFSNNLLTGIGTSNYYLEMENPKYLGVKSGAHNEFVRAAAEHGILGLFLYVLFISTLFYNIYKFDFDIRIKSILIIFTFSFVFAGIHNGQKISLQAFMIYLVICIFNVNKFNKNKLVPRI
jgi:O-antigen ligase